MNRIAFFGGSFDPPHRGHLAIARAAADTFSLDRVLFAPVAKQPLKQHQAATPFVDRYAMVELATQEDPRFVPSRLDAPREPESKPNYTVDTLTRLRAELTEKNDPAAIFTLLGIDSWLTMNRWHHATQLLSLCDWIVAARPGFSLDDAHRSLPPRVTAEEIADDSGRRFLLHNRDYPNTTLYFLPYTHEDIAATGLRDAFHNGAVEKKFIPPAVLDYIRKAGLYK